MASSVSLYIHCENLGAKISFIALSRDLGIGVFISKEKEYTQIQMGGSRYLRKKLGSKDLFARETYSWEILGKLVLRIHSHVSSKGVGNG